jgi:hypothetical protein
VKPGCNLGANSSQANPNKTKQNCLDLFGLIRPNRDFSKGYEQKNKKNQLASQVVCKTSQADFLSLFPPPSGRFRRFGEGSMDSGFRKEIVDI